MTWINNNNIPTGNEPEIGTYIYYIESQLAYKIIEIGAVVDKDFVCRNGYVVKNEKGKEGKLIEETLKELVAAKKVVILGCVSSKRFNEIIKQLNK